MKKVFILLGALLLTTSVYANDYYNYTVKPSSNWSVKGTSNPRMKVRTNRKNEQNLIMPRNSTISYIPITAIDPYIIEVDNKTYYLIYDRKEGQYSYKDIVGYNDRRDDLFASLLLLESDGDKTKITSKELQKANVRFAELGFDGKIVTYDKSRDFNLLNIDYIDIKNRRNSLNNGVMGSFGYFDVYIKNGKNSPKKIIGQVTYTDDDMLKSLF